MPFMLECRRISRDLTFLAVAASFGLAPAALAAGDECSPRIPYTMPDLDQARTGLAGGGLNHCVPTCTMNIFKYLTNHGYPGLAPGSGPWSGSAPVDTSMTTAISLLGSNAYMMTVPSGMGAGTSGTNAVNGINQWFNDSGVAGDIVVTAKWVSGGDAPELGDIALSMLLNRPISLSVGWYLTNPQVLGQLQRSGGHCISAVRLPDYCTSNRKISIRDPGNGGDPNSQQPGTTETYSVQTQSITLIDSMGATYYTGPLERMLSYSSGAKPGYIDGFRSFTPSFGIAACNSPSGGLCVQVYSPHPSFTGPGQSVPLDLPNAANVLDIEVHPSTMKTLALVTSSAGNTVLKVFENRPGAAGVDVPLLINPRRICTGRSWGRVFVLSNDGMTLLSAPLPGSGSTSNTSVSLPQAVDAICFDQATNEVVGLALSARKVIRRDADTLALRSTSDVPTSVPLITTARIAISPADGHLWIAQSNTQLHELVQGAGGLALVGSVPSPTGQSMIGVSLDDKGRVYTSIAGAVQMFQRSSAGAWVPMGDGGYAMPVLRGAFAIARSRSNVTSGLHDVPEWTTPEIPTTFAPGARDCRADYNFSGAVSVQDIFDFLNAWFAADLGADINESLSVSVQDVFDYLELWFAGC